MLVLFRIGDVIRNKNGEQLDQAGEACEGTSQWLSQRSISGCNAAMHLGNDTKASKLYSGRYALHDAKDPDANFQQTAPHIRHPHD